MKKSVTPVDRSGSYFKVANTRHTLALWLRSVLVSLGRLTIVAHLAEDHAPPMPQFGEVGEGASTTFGDDVYKDDVLAEGGGDDRYGEETEALDDRVVDLPPADERRDQCRAWRTQHAVSPGVSWGTLPADLQKTWRDYDCDIFLQDAVQGMLADAEEHVERRESLDAKVAARLDDDFFDDKGDDDVVGDISSIS